MAKICPRVRVDVIQADWADVEEATKYSVNVIATYDAGISGDPADDTTMDWDFGTGDRTDGLPIKPSGHRGSGLAVPHCSNACSISLSLRLV